ncbi:MAG: hypothetical protein HQM06_07455 [Magnetococcales bacterium]|nr:hypothetical protein [Magnetococcales bacterium]
MSNSGHALIQDRQTIRVVYLLGGVALLLMCSLAILGRLVVDVDRLQPKIINALEKVTGRTVSLDGIHFAPTEGFFALELRNLQIHALTDSEPPLLIAKKVQIGLAPFSFLYHSMEEDAPLVISSLTLFNPQIQVVRQEDVWLAQQLQEMIVQSDLQMKHHFGLGLTRLAVNSVKIQNGIFTLLNWQQATSQAVIIDRVYGDIHALTPEKPSPVSLSARFHAIPFTVTGQIGPLPESLDLTAMPVLLNLEAKSTTLLQFIDYFVSLVSLLGAPMPTVSIPEQWDIRGARGYFFTLFNGSLKKGIQTRSRLELDKLVIANRQDKEVAASQQQAFFPIVGNYRGDLGGMKDLLPIDVAFRQKSVLRLEEQSNRPMVWLEECFLYADGRPVLDVKGMWRGAAQQEESDGESFLNLWFSTLSSIDTHRFSHVLAPYLSGETPQGVVHVEGGWPDALHWSGQLDLTQTDLSWSGSPETSASRKVRNSHRNERRRTSVWQNIATALQIDKREGVPLFVEWDVVQDQTEEFEDMVRIKELILSRPASANEPTESRLRVSGSLVPMMQLEISGDWEVSRIKEYLQRAAGWHAAGMMQFDLTVQGDGLRTLPHEEVPRIQSLSGQLTMDGGQLAGVEVQDLSLRLKQEKNILRLHDMEATIGMGRVNGQAWIELAGTERMSEQEAVYHGLFSFTGVALDKLSGSRQGGYVGLSANTRQGGKRSGAAANSRSAVPNKSLTARPLLEGIAFGHGEMWGVLNEEWLFTSPYSGQLHLQVEAGRMPGVNGELFLRPPGDPQRIYMAEKSEVSEEGGQDKGSGRETTLPPQPFYWDKLLTDISWNQEAMQFNPLLLQAGGLRISGSGVRQASGQHSFDLSVSSPLRDESETYRARLEGDLQQTFYRLDKGTP